MAASTQVRRLDVMIGPDDEDGNEEQGDVVLPDADPTLADWDTRNLPGSEVETR